MLDRRVTELLAPGGPFAARWERYEERAGQRQLAADIALAFERGGLLLAEAPTGIGKSLAYLVPGVLLAAERGERVVIATCTRSLQDQLYERDVPAVLEALGLDVPAVRLKGKQNYVCPRLVEGAETGGAEEEETLEELRRWAAGDDEGDLDRFPASDPESFRRVRARVCADAEACTLATCRRGRECAWVRARRRAAQSKLLIVNHALLALSAGVEGLLPEFDVLVVDEAHRLEGVLLAQLERAVSRHRFEEALRALGGARPGPRTLVARLRAYAAPLFRDATRAAALEDGLESLTRGVPECRAAVETLFAAVEPRGPRHALYGVRERYRSASELLGPDLGPLERVLEHCASFARTLVRFADVLDDGAGGAAAGDLAAEVGQLAGRWSVLASDLERVTDAAEPGWVYWRTAGGRGIELHGAPITVGEHARRMVTGRARAAVLTSATLSASGDFRFVAERLGLGETWRAPYEVSSQVSPFPLERQMRAFVHGAGDEASVATLVAELARTTGRSQLVLFTAHERLKRARERLLGLLPSGQVLLAQEWDGPASLVTERFRIQRGAILLGVQSLWEGVDFPGAALEIVVVAKLPFSVPDDPLVEARGERLRDQGLDPFHHDAVPEAVLRFRQGVGRLIRRGDDRGVLVVCDPRLTTASYRRAFLDALPVAPTRIADPRQLAAEAARFLAGEVPVEERS